MTLWIEKIQNAKSLEELENLRVDTLGKKGILTLEFTKMKDIPADEKKSFAENLNLQKEQITKALDSKKVELDFEALNKKLESEKIDVTKFNNELSCGAYHPVAETMNRITNYFLNLNFAVEEGPLVEDDFHNFQALNLPEYHPARDMADTFYNKDYTLLRTHTSPVQIRTMLTQKAPIRMIAPGTVFRRDFDITHTPMFHQIEALVVDDADKISFANLKHVLVEFLQHMFGEVEVRFRPSYFPFTEPSAEIDVSCFKCNGKGCSVCKYTGWIEVLGAGMVHPNVLEMAGVDSNVYGGFAFGLGPDRFAMLKYGVDDIREFYLNDVRFLSQFSQKG